MLSLLLYIVHKKGKGRWNRIIPRANRRANMHINLPFLVAVTGSTRWQAVHSMAIVSKHLQREIVRYCKKYWSVIWEKESVKASSYLPFWLFEFWWMYNDIFAIENLTDVEIFDVFIWPPARTPWFYLSRQESRWSNNHIVSRCWFCVVDK